MNNLDSVYFNYADFLADRAYQSLPWDAKGVYSDLLWQAMIDCDGGFVLVRGDRSTPSQVARFFGCPMSALETLLAKDLLALEGELLTHPLAAFWLDYQDARRTQTSNARRSQTRLPKSTSVNERQRASTSVNATDSSANEESSEKGVERREKRQSPISSSVEPKASPARAHDPAGQRESDADFWGPKIEAVYQAIHGQAPQRGSREAIAAALRTTRASDCVLAIEGARRNPWAMQQASRQALPGILSPKRLDGHIQDARGFYGWVNGEGETWAETMMREHGRGK